MKRSLLIACALLASANALAQADDVTTSGNPALDLSVPREPIQYRSDPTYSSDPPGAYYGDKSGKPAAATVREQQRIAAQAEQCQGELHGSVTAGVGYSNHGGNSNWQGANLNSCKTYYGDDGKPRTIGVSISVGRGEGALFGPGYYGGPGWYGPGPGGW
ncbi:MAG TPA: hypothetical protein DDZ67_15160 [Xanthomonadaceae bacterium]|nr:hypothetical protein [Xanthomonadaceae bacterium]